MRAAGADGVQRLGRAGAVAGAAQLGKMRRHQRVMVLYHWPEPQD